MQHKSIAKNSFWVIFSICLISAIWLISIPGEKQNSIIFNLSLARIVLLVMVITPVVFTLSLIKISPKFRFSNPARKLSKFGDGLSSLIIITGFFFLLIPFSKFRIQVDQAVWIRLLPVYICYILISFFWVIFYGLRSKRIRIDLEEHKNREIFIDFARGFAIVLAIGSHSFFAFGYENIFGDSQFIIKSITRFATPLFVIITGMMFELVYLKKSKKFGFRNASHSLLLRASQCYLAYLATLVFEWFNQLLSTKEILFAALFVGDSVFSGILKFYVLFLILAILIIRLRQKFGIWSMVVLLIVVWVVNLFLNQLFWPMEGDHLSYLTALVFGHPSISSFSVWHAITFMSYGMLLGYFLKKAQLSLNWKYFKMSIASLFLISLVVTLIIVYPASWQDIVYHFANDFRSDHNIAYYSIGNMGAMAILWFFWLIRNHLNPRILKFSFTTLGKDSLWAFAVGNSLAALFPSKNSQPLSVFLFFIAVWLGTIIIIYFKNYLIQIFKY